MNLPERFMSKIYFEPNTGCWIWGGCLTNNGYGISWNNGKRSLAHRYTYTVVKGPIPDSLEVDHLCRVRACCNPDHLEVVTRQENMRRSPHFKDKEVCLNGHPMVGRNRIACVGKIKIYYACRECKRLARAEYRRKYETPKKASHKKGAEHGE